MQLQGAITSVAAHGDHYFVGTNKSNVYYVNAKTFKEELRQVLLGSLFLDRAQLNHTVRGWSHSSLKNRGGVFWSECLPTEFPECSETTGIKVPKMNF